MHRTAGRVSADGVFRATERSGKHAFVRLQPARLIAIVKPKRSPCALHFRIAAEGGWDLGGATASLISAALLWFGAPLGVCILLSLIGAFAAFALLRRYYAASGTSAAPAAVSELAGP